MISPEETTGSAHDESRAPLPASTRVYVEGQLHPSVRQLDVGSVVGVAREDANGPDEAPELSAGRELEG